MSNEILLDYFNFHRKETVSPGTRKYLCYRHSGSGEWCKELMRERVRKKTRLYGTRSEAMYSYTLNAISTLCKCYMAHIHCCIHI